MASLNKELAERREPAVTLAEEEALTRALCAPSTTFPPEPAGTVTGALDEKDAGTGCSRLGAT